MTDNVKNIDSLHYGVYYDSKMLYGIDPRACTIKHYKLIIFDVRSKLISSPKQDLNKEKTLAYYELWALGKLTLLLSTRFRSIFIAIKRLSRLLHYTFNGSFIKLMYNNAYRNSNANGNYGVNV